MSDTFTGTISFIQHHKNYAVLEYEHKDKTLGVKAYLPSTGISRKPHQFVTGDVVEFTLANSGNTQKKLAHITRFLYNNLLDDIIHKARSVNSFMGYIKKIDENYFIKEVVSYLFFPLPMSTWQIPPDEEQLNEPVPFYLENLDKKEKLQAILFDKKYIPQFSEALKWFKNKTVLNATVNRVSPTGIFIQLPNNGLQGKIKMGDLNPDQQSPEPGQEIPVIITFLNKDKIVLQQDTGVVS